MPKVFLSAGHGGNDPGAVAFGMKEKDINLTIMLACNEVLVKHGVITILSRTKDENDPVSQEVKEANASGSNVAISFHTNAGGGDGSETLYHSSSVNGKKLADLCEKHTRNVGQNSRGVKKRDDLHFLKGTKMPAVLCECAFIDNDTDNNIIDTTNGRKVLGIAYAKAILEYFNITYKGEPDKTYTVQVGTYKTKTNADNMLKMLKTAGFSEAFVRTI